MIPLAPELYKIQITVSRETHDNLRRAQDLLRHVIPDGDPAAIVERALTLLVEGSGTNAVGRNGPTPILAETRAPARDTYPPRSGARSGPVMEDSARSPESKAAAPNGVFSRSITLCRLLLAVPRTWRISSFAVVATINTRRRGSSDLCLCEKRGAVTAQLRLNRVGPPNHAIADPSSAPASNDAR